MPRFQTKPVVPTTVDAIELRGPCRLGKAKGRAGDFLVTHPDHRQELVPGGVFAATYEPIGENGTAPAAVAPRVATRPKTSAPGRGGHGRARDPENVAAEAAAKKLWEAGTSVKEIARQVKKSVTMIYHWSSEGKWQRPKSGTAASPAGVGAKQLAGQVHCTSCTLMTSTDPCEKCGSKLKSGW